jgi:hypothetical protein
MVNRTRVSRTPLGVSTALQAFIPSRIQAVLVMVLLLARQRITRLAAVLHDFLV